MDFHLPVLLNEVLTIFDVQENSIYLDATVGNGGHSLGLLEKGAIVYGLDQDPANLKIATDRIIKAGFKDRFFPINNNFNQLESIIHDNLPKIPSGILFDLGLSSGQLKTMGRGFSYDDDQSIDMRLDPSAETLTAEEVINTYSYEQLYNIFTLYAQEKLSKPLIIRIISERQKSPIKSGARLASIIRQYYQDKHQHPKIDPSTKIFMALRIYVNNEFNNLKKILEDTLKYSGTQIVIISFHSGEDRIVKNFIRKATIVQKIHNLTPKAIMPSSAEIKQNNLSRSAILRSYKIV